MIMKGINIYKIIKIASVFIPLVAILLSILINDGTPTYLLVIINIKLALISLWLYKWANNNIDRIGY